MKKILLSAMILMCCACLAFAQPPGSVGVYADSAGWSHLLYDATGEDFQDMWFYFIHVNDVAATAVEFSFDTSNLTYHTDLGDVCPWALRIGDFKNGISISYGSCQFPTPGYGVYLGKTGLRHGKNFQHYCAYACVKNNPIPGIPGATTPLGAGCSGTWLVLRGSYIIVSHDFANCGSSIEASSWGRIKALYE
jgi:hypothetical protein